MGAFPAIIVLFLGSGVLAVGAVHIDAARYDWQYSEHHATERCLCAVGDWARPVDDNEIKQTNKLEG